MQLSLTVDQVDAVLIEELKRVWTDKIAEPKQLKAIRRVLKYYMMPDDYEAFINPPATDSSPDEFPMASNGRSFQVGDRVMVKCWNTETTREDVITKDDGSDDDKCPYWTGPVGTYGAICHDTKDLTLIKRAA